VGPDRVLETALRLAFLAQHLRPAMQARRVTGLSAVRAAVVADRLCKLPPMARQAVRAGLAAVAAAVVAVAAIRALAARAVSVAMAIAS
jgi:hypothetical protein